MTKEEFIKELRSALSGEVNQNELNENIQYYDQYLSQEQQKGRTIDEIVDEIGNPRLIAKTIIDTSSNVSSGSSYYEQKIDSEDNNHQNRNEENYSRTVRKTRIRIWAAILIMLLIVIGVFAILGRVIFFFAPILVPLLLISIAVRLLTRQHN